MLKTAESFEKKEKVIHMKKWIKGAVAASLAVAVTAGAVIGFNLFGGKANSFVMTVNAAEITKNNPVSVGLGEGGMSIAPKDDGMEYYIDLPLSVKGEHIKSVYCTVTFDDGTVQKQSIHIGTTVTNFGTAHSESFNKLTEEEKALKDYTDVFVTYSITE